MVQVETPKLEQRTALEDLFQLYVHDFLSTGLVRGKANWRIMVASSPMHSILTGATKLTFLCYFVSTQG